MSVQGVKTDESVGDKMKLNKLFSKDQSQKTETLHPDEGSDLKTCRLTEKGRQLVRMNVNWVRV